LKLLFDANLSPKLVVRLGDLFPGSAHVFQTALARFTPDEKIWDYARENAFTIVTADSDFVGMAQRYGCPPSVIRLQNCNYRTALVEELLRRNAVRIADLEQSKRAVLVIRNIP
jgi:predicted nuclease of predicted toxin-antitoxin system